MNGFRKKKFISILKTVSRKINTELIPNRYWLKLWCTNKICNFI